MKVTIELDRVEFSTALNNGALNALSQALERPASEEGASVNASTQFNAPASVAVPPMAPTQPIYTPPAAPVQQASAPIVPTTPKTYTMDQLAVAATQLVDAGRRNELVGLLQSFGVQALTTLPKEKYGAFATQLRAMGAKI